MLSIIPPISSLLEGKKQNGVSGVFLASGNENLDRGELQKSLKMMLETGRKRGLVSVHRSTIFIWAITLQIEPSPSTGTKWGLLVINNAVWKQRDLLKKKKKSKALAGMAIISTSLLESDKGMGPCRMGCLAPGQLEMTNIPATGTHCRLIPSANGQNQNVLGSFWRLSDIVNVKEQP